MATLSIAQWVIFGWFLILMVFVIFILVNEYLGKRVKYGKHFFKIFLAVMVGGLLFATLIDPAILSEPMIIVGLFLFLSAYSRLRKEKSKKNLKLTRLGKTFSLFAILFYIFVVLFSIYVVFLL